MSIDSKQPYWLLFDFVLSGAEEDGNQDAEVENSDNEEENDENPDNSGTGGSSDSGDNIDGLKAALRRERQINKTNTRKLNQLEKASEAKDQQEQSELEKTKAELTASADRSKKLAEGFLKVSLNAAIESMAKKYKFRDTDDALAMVDRSQIDADQDEDDPSLVDIDKASVEAAVKALATAKKHLVSSGTEDDEPTGGQFGGKGKGKPSTTETAYREKYSAL